MVHGDQLHGHFFFPTGTRSADDLITSFLFARETFLANQSMILYTQEAIRTNHHGRADAWIIATRLGKQVDTL
jgi:hypothetical protein